MIIDIPKVLTDISNKGFSDPFIGKWIGINSRNVFNFRHGHATPSLKTASKIKRLHDAVNKFQKDLEQVQDI